MKKLYSMIFIILISFSANGQSISGKISSCTGNNFLRADIQMLSNAPIKPEIITKTIKVNADGNFKIILENTGFYKLRFCAVDHEPLIVPFYINKKENIIVDVKLKPNFNENINELRITGDFNNFRFGSSTVKMIKNENGDFTAEIKAVSDTLAYQVLGLSNNNHTVNFSQADYFVLDSGGDYVSVIKTKKDSLVKIVIKKSDVPNVGCESEVNFKKDNTLTTFVYSLLKDNSNKNLDNLKYDQLSKEEKNLIQFLKIKQTRGIDSTSCDHLLNTLDFDSPIWSIHSFVIGGVISIYPPEKKLKLAIEFIEKNKDETIKPLLYSNLLNTADDLGLNEIVKKYYRKYEEKYSKSYNYKTLRSLYSPDRNVQVGRIIPDFSFVSIDDSTEKVNNENMKGKVFLLDFWATSCWPCVQEMEYLHQANNDFKTKGLRIISVSLDFQIERLTKFREEKWKLPWFNAFVGPDPNNEKIKNFEVTLIPKTMLVNKNGEIIATGSRLRGENLHKTLSEVFDK